MLTLVSAILSPVSELFEFSTQDISFAVLKIGFETEAAAIIAVLLYCIVPSLEDMIYYIRNTFFIAKSLADHNAGQTDPGLSAAAKANSGREKMVFQPPPLKIS